MKKLMLTLAVLVCASSSFAYYDPEQGRFINRDPIAEDGGVNLHGFVGNNAITKIDRYGEAAFTAIIYPDEYTGDESYRICDDKDKELVNRYPHLARDLKTKKDELKNFQYKFNEKITECVYEESRKQDTVYINGVKVNLSYEEYKQAIAREIDDSYNSLILAQEGFQEWKFEAQTYQPYDSVSIVGEGYVKNDTAYYQAFGFSHNDERKSEELRNVLVLRAVRCRSLRTNRMYVQSAICYSGDDITKNVSGIYVWYESKENLEMFEPWRLMSNPGAGGGYYINFKTIYFKVTQEE